MAERIVYHHELSQPARAVLAFCLANEGLGVKFKVVDLKKGEHRAPEFLKMNPDGTVPTYNEGDFSIGESHTILRYLASDASVPDHWYPADPKKRAKVDEYLDWHHTHTRKGYHFVFHKYVSQQLLGIPGKDEGREEGKKDYIRAIEYLEKNHLDSPFLCGDEITLADLSAYTELGAVQNDDEFKVVYEEYPKVKAWMKRMGEQEWHDEVMGPAFKMISSSE